jgi:uncharacterized protein
MNDTPFWKRKSLTEMTASEWESLCDGCGWCCMVKFAYDDDPSITYFTDVACALLDHSICRCSDYAHRQERFKECISLTPRNIRRESMWNRLPPTCGYRLVADGHDLYWWHHLVSGDRDTVHLAGMSVYGRIADSEDNVADADLDDHIIRSSDD